MRNSHSGVGVDDLIGEKTALVKRGPTPKLQQQVERLGRLPQPKQLVVMAGGVS